MRSYRYVIAVAAFLCLAQDACIAQDKVPVRIPAGSDIKIIEHFNDGKDPNEIGGVPALVSKKPAFLQAAYNNKVRRTSAGYSLEMEFYIPKGERASWSTGLNDLDISAAKGVSFWMKGSEGSEKLWLSIEDGYGAKKEADISGLVSPSTDWQEIKVPMEKFPGLDMNKMGKLSFIFKGEPSVISGKIYLDDISFYGDK
ncbi:MAG TPA: carbohydrate binding domain-containing protein, partial [Candidatus Omnitrophota bacterium]|nr:carbohydrate binding domain-containing protein [Candidatus Omnitrophota bacterium]